MIKRVKAKSLRPGMFVHDFNCGWMENPFFSKQKKLETDSEVEKIINQGLKEVYIDTEKGLDVQDGVSQKEVAKEIDNGIHKIDREKAPSKTIPIHEEIRHAAEVKKEAMKVVKDFMAESIKGKEVQVEKVDKVVESMVDSIFRNKDALEVLGKVRKADEYTFQHSVNVCVLMVSFAKSLGLDRGVINKIGSGALLHDIGKMHVPQNVLNKAGKLDDNEFVIMKDHVVQSAKILSETPGVDPISLAVAAQHHERYDGTGYPKKLKGEQIVVYGRQAAIVDVYDAITADRVYHKGMPSTQALKKLFEWSRFHFDASLVQQFIKSVGVYPSGSLVRMESGLLAVVIEQGIEDLTKPVVKVVYDAKRKIYLSPYKADLANPTARIGDDRILAAENAEKWGINPMDFMEIPDLE